MPDDGVAVGLPPEVCQRIATECPHSGTRILACLATAARFLEMAKVGEDGLQWAESAAYNLREALDAVVQGQKPAEGGLGALRPAWDHYQMARQTGTDVDGAWANLYQALAAAFADQPRLGYRDAQLLEYLRAQAGIEPLSGALDPVEEYRQLRRDVSRALHGTCGWAKAAGFFERAVNWFLRMFAPPDAQVTWSPTLRAPRTREPARSTSCERHSRTRITAAFSSRG